MVVMYIPYISMLVLFGISSHVLLRSSSIGFELCIEGKVVLVFSFSLEVKGVKFQILWEDSLC